MTQWIVEDPRGRKVLETDDPAYAERFRRGSRYTVHRVTDTEDEEPEDADTEEAPSATSSPSTHADQDDGDDGWEPPTTSDGTPCTRCVEQGEPCWQHE